MAKKLHVIDLTPFNDPSNEIIYPESFKSYVCLLSFVGVFLDTSKTNAVGFPCLYSTNKQTLQKLWKYAKADVIETAKKIKLSATTTAYTQDAEQIEQLFDQPIKTL